MALFTITLPLVSTVPLINDHAYSDGGVRSQFNISDRRGWRETRGSVHKVSLDRRLTKRIQQRVASRGIDTAAAELRVLLGERRNNKCYYTIDPCGSTR
jgi:hypothetical protein